jgi:hypothetical protein
LLENAPDILFAVHGRNDLKQFSLRPLNDCVIRIAGQRPETQRADCRFAPEMTAQITLGDKRAAFIDRLLDPVGNLLLGNEGPDIESVGSRKRRERLTASALLTPGGFHRLNVAAG